MGQFHHGPPSDALKNTGIRRGCEQCACTHDEDVVPGALGHFALVVEHQGFHAAGLQSLQFGHDVVKIIERLDSRAQRGRMRALRCSRHDAQPFLVVFAGVKTDGVSDHDHLRIFCAVGVEAKAACAAGHHQTNVAVVQRIGSERVDDGFGNCLL